MGFNSGFKGLTFNNSTWCSLCVECFVGISEQTATFVSYVINSLVFITVVESVYSAVRTDSLYKADCASSLNGQTQTWLLTTSISLYTCIYTTYICITNREAITLQREEYSIWVIKCLQVNLIFMVSYIKI